MVTPAAMAYSALPQEDSPVRAVRGSPSPSRRSHSPGKQLTTGRSQPALNDRAKEMKYIDIFEDGDGHIVRDEVSGAQLSDGTAGSMKSQTGSWFVFVPISFWK